MSEKPPTPAGENPPHTEPDTGRSLDEIAAANIVPATEPPPREDIEMVTEHLKWHEVPHTDESAEEEPHPTSSSGSARASTPPPPRSTSTGGGGGGASGGSAGGHGKKGKVAGMFGNVFALFGWFFVHIVWQGITRAHEMAKGGGGGHSKPKASGGGGHH